jgi:hypothetical protein
MPARELLVRAVLAVLLVLFTGAFRGHDARGHARLARLDLFDVARALTVGVRADDDFVHPTGHQVVFLDAPPDLERGEVLLEEVLLAVTDEGVLRLVGGVDDRPREVPGPLEEVLAQRVGLCAVDVLDRLGAPGDRQARAEGQTSHDSC